MAELIKDAEDEMIDVAKEANKLILEKDIELKQLKAKLAKSELYRTVPEEVKEEEKYNQDEQFNYSGKSSYDICDNWVKRYEYEVSNGLPISFGSKAPEIVGWIKERLEVVKDEVGRNRDNAFSKLYADGLIQI